MASRDILTKYVLSGKETKAITIRKCFGRNSILDFEDISSHFLLSYFCRCPNSSYAAPACLECMCTDTKNGIDLPRHNLSDLLCLFSVSILPPIHLTSPEPPSRHRTPRTNKLSKPTLPSLNLQRRQLPKELPHHFPLESQTRQLRPTQVLNIILSILRIDHFL